MGGGARLAAGAREGRVAAGGGESLTGRLLQVAAATSMGGHRRAWARGRERLALWPAAAVVAGPAAAAVAVAPAGLAAT